MWLRATSLRGTLLWSGQCQHPELSMQPMGSPSCGCNPHMDNDGWVWGTFGVSLPERGQALRGSSCIIGGLALHIWGTGSAPLLQSAALTRSCCHGLTCSPLLLPPGSVLSWMGGPPSSDP